MDLGRLKRLVDALVQEQGEDAPVAAFIFTAADVTGITSDSFRSTRNTRIDPAEVLLELQSNAGDIPLEDQILEALEEIVQEKLRDAD